MVPNDPLINTVVGDDFRIVRQIGFGGYARVYMAEQISVGKRKVAVKVLHQMHMEAAAAVAGMKREAAYLAMLRHPCFPRILRTGNTHEGLPYFVMELVTGRTLDVQIRDGGPMPLAQVVTLMDQILEAVAEMHTRDIIHRDIKTGNIFLDEGPGIGVRVRMLDLGSAKPAYEKDVQVTPQNPLAVGSPPYIAPETAATGVMNESTDIYSLGTVAYEMLCGIRALHLKDTSPESYGEYLKSDRAIPTYRIGTIQPEIPEAVENVVHRALDRKPGERFSSVIEFRKSFLEAVRTHVGEEVDRILLRPAQGKHQSALQEGAAGKSILARLVPLRFRKQ